jgi:ribosomal protein S14
VTVRSQRLKWAKRFVLPAALVVMGGMGVALALPASADDLEAHGVGNTPEEATRKAIQSCYQQERDEGPITSQGQRPDGLFETFMTCRHGFRSNTTARETGATAEEARANADQVCRNLGSIPVEQLAMFQLEDGRYEASRSSNLVDRPQNPARAETRCLPRTSTKSESMRQLTPVPGSDILLVPDLEAGNMLAKQLTFLADARAAGIVLGARVPIVLTSRSDPLSARLASAALARLVVAARPLAGA